MSNQQMSLRIIKPKAIESLDLFDFLKIVQYGCPVRSVCLKLSYSSTKSLLEKKVK